MRYQKAQNLVEWFLEKQVIYGKDIDYKVTNNYNSNSNTFVIHNLGAEIEDGIVWFGEEDVIDFMIESVKDIDIADDIVDIKLVDGLEIVIQIVK